jgi:hypothetical protein
MIGMILASMITVCDLNDALAHEGWVQRVTAVDCRLATQGDLVGVAKGMGYEMTSARPAMALENGLVVAFMRYIDQRRVEAASKPSKGGHNKPKPKSNHKWG